MGLPPVLAAAAWLGAVHPRGVPVLLGVVAVAAGLLLSRSLVLVVGVVVAASALSAAAWAGLVPVEEQPFEGVVDLVSDPVTGLGGAVEADVRLPDGRRVQAEAHGGAAGVLRGRAAGERVVVVGTLGPPPEDAPWLVPRHVAGRLQVDDVTGWRAGGPVSRMANALRRTLVAGTTSFSPDRRALFAGLVLGDDREQSPEDTDAFRAAGLGHLLAVSGQNVAFVLVVVRPLARRCGSKGQIVVVVAALGLFACTTRFEPSVLRAVAMAAIAALAASSGRRVAGVQVLALAVLVLVLVDPLLVHALGFRLSVAASAGILLLAPWLRTHLPGPGPLAEAVAVTVAAQVAVAPLLLPVFGGMPVAALPANVLAAPAAGPITAWGLTGGLLAGLVPEQAAAVLHLPTRLLLWWIDLVAHLAVHLGLGELGPVHLAVLVVLVGCALVAARVRRRLLLALLAVVVLAQPSVALRGPLPDEVDVAGGGVLRRGGGASALVVDGRAHPETLLEDLRREGVRRLDLVVARTAGAGPVVDVLRDRYAGLEVIGPEGLGAADLVVHEPTTISVGGLHLLVVPDGGALGVEAARAGSAVGPVG